jgi:hypothetical protein
VPISPGHLFDNVVPYIRYDLHAVLEEELHVRGVGCRSPFFHAYALMVIWVPTGNTGPCSAFHSRNSHHQRVRV